MAFAVRVHLMLDAGVTLLKSCIMKGISVGHDLGQVQGRALGQDSGYPNRANCLAYSGMAFVLLYSITVPVRSLRNVHLIDLLSSPDHLLLCQTARTSELYSSCKPVLLAILEILGIKCNLPMCL